MDHILKMIELSPAKRLKTKKWSSWAKPKALNLELIELSWASQARVWAAQPSLSWGKKFGTIPLFMGGGGQKSLESPELARKLIGQIFKFCW